MGATILSRRGDVVGRSCFFVESKSFEIEEVGVVKKAMVIITERRWGRMSWIRFGEEGENILLKSVESLRAEADKNIEGLVWCKNGRRYSLEMRTNEQGRFLICSVIDLDGKRHGLLFPEGNGLINGWTILEKALQALGQKESRGDRGKAEKTHSSGKEDLQKGREV